MQTWGCSGDESGMNLLESWRFNQPPEYPAKRRWILSWYQLYCTNPKRNHRKVMCHYFDRILLFYLFGD